MATWGSLTGKRRDSLLPGGAGTARASGATGAQACQGPRSGSTVRVHASETPLSLGIEQDFSLSLGITNTKRHLPQRARHTHHPEFPALPASTTRRMFEHIQRFGSRGTNASTCSAPPRPDTLNLSLQMTRIPRRTCCRSNY